MPDGLKDGREGREKTPPKSENSLLDYVFVTYQSEEKLKEQVEKYDRDYETGTQQRLADELAKKK